MIEGAEERLHIKFMSTPQTINAHFQGVLVKDCACLTNMTKTSLYTCQNVPKIILFYQIDFPEQCHYYFAPPVEHCSKDFFWQGMQCRHFHILECKAKHCCS